MKTATNISPSSLLALLVLALFSTFILPACRTMEGAGKDVERAGEKIQDNAQKH